MIIAKPATYDAVRPVSTFSAMVVGTATQLPKGPGIRDFALQTWSRASMSFEPLAVRQVREDGEYYIPDRLTDEDGEADQALVEAALAYTRKARDAQGLLDDAISLVGVLLDALEQDADTRAAQARTVLEMAVECIHNAHARIDEQESQDQNLFLAHFEGGGEEEEKEEAGPPMDG
jgi:hypothetical protein